MQCLKLGRASARVGLADGEASQGQGRTKVDVNTTANDNADYIILTFPWLSRMTLRTRMFRTLLILPNLHEFQFR
jgi:hypothetical protein